MKSKIHVFSRMFTKPKVSLFLFILFVILTVPSAWAQTISSNGAGVNVPCSGSSSVYLSDNVSYIYVYDDGGPSANYSNSCSGYLSITAPYGKALKVEPYNDMVIEKNRDTLRILNSEFMRTDWSGYYLESMLETRSSGSFDPLYTTGTHMAIQFATDGSITNSGFVLKVSVVSLYTVSLSSSSLHIWDPYRINSVRVGYDDYSAFAAGAKVSLYDKSSSDSYFLTSLKIKDASGNLLPFKEVKKVGDGYGGDSLQFKMPSSNVTVTPTYTSVSNLSSVDMLCRTATLNIPSNISSFKIYDNGGSSENYTNNCDAYLTLNAPKGYKINLSGSMVTEHVADFLRVYEGAGTSGTKLADLTSATTGSLYNFGTVSSSGNVMTLYFRTDASVVYSGLNLTATLVPQSFSISKASYSNGTVTVASSAKVNSTVTITATPNTNYLLKSLTATTTSGANVTLTKGSGNTWTFTMPGENVTIKPVFVADTYSITYKTATGGKVSGVSSAKVGNTVTVTATPSNSSYLLKDINVASSENVTVDVTIFNSFSNTAAFNMPYGNVTVTPSFTNDLRAEGGLYIKMPKSGTQSATIPSNVKSFKIYDDGGKSSNYSNNASGTLYLTAPDGYILLLTGNVNTYNTSDYLQIYNGPSASNADSLLGTRSNNSTCKFYSNARRMTLKFVSDGSGVSSGLDLTVTLVKLNLDLANDGTNNFVNMIYQHKATFNIPTNVSSFKVYDEGGKSGVYSNNNRDTLVLVAPENHVLKLTGSVITAYSGDTLEVYSGSTINSSNLLGKKRSTSNGSSLNIGKMVSNGRYMTLYFESDASSAYSGLDLTVNVVNEENSITINQSEGGMVNCEKSSAKNGSTVQLNVTSNLSAGYLLSGIDIIDGDGDVVKVTSGGNFANPSATFIMPAGPVSVTPHFTIDWNVAGNLYINMPINENKVLSIPSGVQSFKVYDDGGKDGNYSNNYEHSLRLTPPSGYILQLDGSIKTNDDNDYLTVKDYAGGRILLDQGRSMSGKLYAASMLLTFHSDASGNNSGLDLTVTVVPEKTVSVNTATGGKIQVSSNVATPGSTVTLTATMDNGFFFESVDIRDDDNNKISYSVDYPWYSSNSSATITFKMPNSNVSATPKFTNKLTAENAVAINIPASGTQSITIPAAVKSFKVYDNGGKNGYYSNNNNGTLALTAPVGYIFEVTGSMKTNITKQVESESDCIEWQSGYDVAVCGYYYHWYSNTCDAEDNLNVYDGSSTSATPLMQGKYGCVNKSESWGCRVDYNFKLQCNEHSHVNSVWYSIGKIMSSSNKIALNFKSGASGTAEGFDLTVTLRKINADELDVDDNGNQYMNMVLSKKATVNIPSGVTSFKIYDDGGKNGTYSNNNADTLILKAPVGSVIELTGSIKTNIKKTEESWECERWASGFEVNVCDYSRNWYSNTCDEEDNLNVYDGSTTSASKLLNGKYGCRATSDSWYCRLNYLSLSNPNCDAHSNVSWLSVGTLQSSGNTMTLVFKSNSSGNSDGLDLTAKVIMLDYAIQIKNAANGSVTTTKTTKLHAGDTVSLVAWPSSGYKLKDVVAKDLSGNTVKVSQYSFSVSELVMPAKDLVITPTFTNDLTAAGGLHLDMRKNKNFDASFTEDIKSFKVYDNGGKDGVYEANSNDTLTLAAPEGYRMKLSGSVIMENGYEFLYVYDGKNTKATNLLTTTGSANSSSTTASKNIGTVTSSSRYMTIRFKSDPSYQYAGLDLTVTLEKVNYTITRKSVTGGTLYSKDADTLDAVVYLTGSPTDSYHLSDVTVVDKDENVLKSPIYSFDRSKFTMPASNVTVTPTFTNNLTAEGGLHLDLLKNGKTDANIPAGVKSFNLYDNGGKNGTYESNSSDTLTLTAPEGFYLVVSGSTVLDKNGDSLYIFNGANTSASKLYGTGNAVAGATAVIKNEVVSTGRSLTFRFKSNSTGQYSGLNLKVSVEPVTYGITVVNAANGHVSSDKTRAAKDSIVNLSWSVNTEGYLIRSIDIKDASNNKIAVNGGWYSGDNGNFIMPGRAVTVTPSFTKNLTAKGNDGLYINMPKAGTVNASIPAKVTSFKVYDDGGATNAYSNGCDGTLVLNAPEGYLLQLSGSVAAEASSDYLDVYDGADNTAIKLVDKKTGSATITSVLSSGRNLTLFFHSDGSGVNSGLDLTVTLVHLGIEIAEVTGGSMTSDMELIPSGETVTLTATPDEGYLFDGVSVEDADGNAVALSKDIHWYSGVSENTVSFVMPANAVTVTPKFSAVDELYVNIPNTCKTTDVIIPVGVPSFKIYDDGGKDGVYSNNFCGMLNISLGNGVSSEVGGLRISGSVASREGDVLSITSHVVLAGKEFYRYEGSADGESVNIGSYVNSFLLLVDFRSNAADNADGLDLTVSTVPALVQDGGAVKILYDDAGAFFGTEVKSEKVAYIDGDYKGNVPVNIYEDVSVDTLLYSREFPTGTFSTMVLPFSVNTENVEGLNAVLRYNGIKTVDGKSSIRMKVVWATDDWVFANKITDSQGKSVHYDYADMNANTPYLVQMGESSFKLKSAAFPLTIKKTAPADTTVDGWTFRGTWEYKMWEEGDPELGYAYGFAASASETNNIKVGDFVKVGVGAWIRPMRAYLVKAELPEKSAQLARANGAYVKRPTVVPEELPELMSIVIDGDDDNEEHTTVIGHFNTRTGEIKMNYDRGKFDLKGRHVNGSNNARGAYYGKKILKK